MGLMDGMLGGIVGAVATTAVQRLIQQHGGVAGVVQHLEQNGLGETVRSWVGTGANQPVSPAQLHQVFGADKILQLAQSLGVSPEELLQKMAAVLPETIDRMTPGGAVPQS